MSRIDKSSHFHVIQHELISEFSFDLQFPQLKHQLLSIDGVKHIYMNLMGFPLRIIVITIETTKLMEVQDEAKKIGVHLLPKLVD